MIQVRTQGASREFTAVADTQLQINFATAVGNRLVIMHSGLAEDARLRIIGGAGNDATIPNGTVTAAWTNQQAGQVFGLSADANFIQQTVVDFPILTSRFQLICSKGCTLHLTLLSVANR